MYNLTQLHPDKVFEKSVYHRDQFAHYLRWAHVLKLAKIGMNILDWGCASGDLAEVLYRNRFKANKYLGLDIRDRIIIKNSERYEKIDWIDFHCVDLCDSGFYCGKDWDIISCFEVIEHVGKDNVNIFLQNIKKHMNKNTILLISTPCYNGKNVAKNHMIDGKVGELTYNEMLNALTENGFTVEANYGTFASIVDYKDKLNDWQEKMFNKLREYYDSNLLSVIMAPFFPASSRNVIWRCKLNDKI